MAGDSLGDRMKGYERSLGVTLPRRMPVIVRVDGKAFHTLTKGLGPFDRGIQMAMVHVGQALFKEIHGAQFAFMQSDEVSVLVHGFKRFASTPWFDNKLQKMISVAAGVASATFTAERIRQHGVDRSVSHVDGENKIAVFDARAFVIPEADVCNYFLWRQQDATRNALMSLARTMFSHQAVQGKCCGQLRPMCGGKWEALSSDWKRGVGIYDQTWVGGHMSKAFADYNVPVFSSDRDFINRWLALEEE